MLLKGHTIKIGIREDINYNVLIQKSNIDQVLWTLLYYVGYLTKYDNLCIPNMEVSMEWQEWQTNCNLFELDLMLSLLLQVESNYHLFMLGMFHQAYRCVNMEFQVLPKLGKNEKPQNEKLQNNANEALKQIKHKCYFSDL
ncbi:19224_t:CDS:2 [Gigaspora rosea]|nr:19224_t:CDS:2 [Gigaspora rosea]